MRIVCLFRRPQTTRNTCLKSCTRRAANLHIRMKSDLIALRTDCVASSRMVMAISPRVLFAFIMPAALWSRNAALISTAFQRLPLPSPPEHSKNARLASVIAACHFAASTSLISFTILTNILDLMRPALSGATSPASKDVQLHYAAWRVQEDDVSHWYAVLPQSRLALSPRLL